MESQVGGNIMQPNRSKSQILVFNDKPGQLNVLDLKMNKLVANISLHNDEVTAVTMNESGNVLVVGFRDGLVKIYNVDKEYELRESFMAFPAINNKKGSVTALKLHPSNGALFGSSQTGNLKVLRPKI
jgi:WD40 repeat protein